MEGENPSVPPTSHGASKNFPPPTRSCTRSPTQHVPRGCLHISQHLGSDEGTDSSQQLVPELLLRGFYIDLDLASSLRQNVSTHVRLKLSKGPAGDWQSPPCPSGLGAPWRHFGKQSCQEWLHRAGMVGFSPKPHCSAVEGLCGCGMRKDGKEV